MFGVMIELYPHNENDPPRFVLHNEIFSTEGDAQSYIDQARRMNLPFRSKWIINFTDPRAET